MLKEYEEARAHIVTVEFENDTQKEKFLSIADKENTISAMEAIGHHDLAKRAQINTIIIGLVSDYLHHIYESLKCFEKRKFIVGFNLLRKPLKDNLLYLSWILGDEDSFYNEFNTGNPNRLTQRALGGKRVTIFDQAVSKTQIPSIFSGKKIEETIFRKENENGFEKLFQHSVHLITNQNPEITSSSHNFNFIFKSPISEDVYYHLYENLPYILLYSTQIIYQLFFKMKPADPGSNSAFLYRTIYSYASFSEMIPPEKIEKEIKNVLKNEVNCKNCKNSIKITKYNTVKLIMTDKIRCNKCKRIEYVPFSWIF